MSCTEEVRDATCSCRRSVRIHQHSTPFPKRHVPFLVDGWCTSHPAFRLPPCFSYSGPYPWCVLTGTGFAPKSPDPIRTIYFNTREEAQAWVDKHNEFATAPATSEATHD